MTLSRAALAAAGVSRATVTIGSLMLDARQSGAVQIIAHASNPSRVVAVFPTGMVWGNGPTPTGWFDMVADVQQTGMAYTERMEVFGL